MGVGVVTLWGVVVGWNFAVGADPPVSAVMRRVTGWGGSNPDCGRGAGVAEPAQAANDIAIGSKARRMEYLGPGESGINCWWADPYQFTRTPARI